jgi:hypothetical protein
MIRGVASLDEVNLVVFNYLSVFEIWLIREVAI